MGDIGFWILVSVGIVVGFMLLIVVIGSFLPKGHRVARSIVLKQTPEAVWAVITDFSTAPNWHADIVKVERMPDKNSHEVWRETYKGDYGMLLETTEATAPTRLVRTIADEGGPFSGRWEFVLSAAETGCIVTITEFGVVPNPFFRFMARMFMRPETYLMLYLTALARKFDERAIPTAPQP